MGRSAEADHRGPIGVIGVAKVAALAIALFLLFPPALLDGRYSPLEVALALLAVGLLPDRGQTSTPVLRAPIALAALMTLMIASTIWSVGPWETFRDGIAYGILAAASLLLARSLAVHHITAAMATVGVGALAVSCALAMLRPDMAIDPWNFLKGIYGNRNGLGYVLVQALPAVIALPLRFRFGWLLRLALLAFLSFGIVASGSKTALVTTAVILAAWTALVIIRRWRVAAVGVAIVAVGTAVLAVLNRGRVLELLGKDPTGSGRTEIWASLLPVIQENPLFGSGWARSWPIGSPQYDAMIAEFGVPFFHAHNEALNWLVTLGVVGLVLLVCLFVFIAWGGWIAWVHRSSGESFILLTLVMIVTRGLTEISETAAQGWLMLALITALSSLHVARGDRRLSRFAILEWPREMDSTSPPVSAAKSR